MMRSVVVSMSSSFDAWDYMLSRLRNTRSYRGFGLMSAAEIVDPRALAGIQPNICPKGIGGLLKR